MLNRAKDYYKNNQEVLKEKAKNNYKELSDEEKDIKKCLEEIDIKICLKKTKKD